MNWCYAGIVDALKKKIKKKMTSLR